MKKTLDLVDIIHRSLDNQDDVRPLIKYLGMNESVLDYADGESRKAAEDIAGYLRKMGSNDLATMLRNGEGVEYSEVVLDVGRKLKADVDEKCSVEKNEEAILLKLFAGALEQMSEEEKRVLFRNMGINEAEIPLGSISAILIQQLLREFGGFSIYKITVIVANMVSRAILGSGLTFATNIALTRTVSALLGPVGWLTTGLWLAFDLAGPAYRKTVPAVVHVALLRSILVNKITIGVVGDGSSGKDSLMQAVFGIKSDINPIAGSTEKVESYPLNDRGNATIVNYPGFNDYREAVDKYTDDNLHHTDVFVLVVDINRGISGSDIKIFEKIKSFGKPFLICLNKTDLVRSDKDKAKLKLAAKERLNVADEDMILTSFDPDPRFDVPKEGVRKVYEWMRKGIEKEGKNVDGGNFPPPPG